MPAKKNLEILAILIDLLDGPGGTIKHDDVRRVASKGSWVASFLPRLKCEAIVGQHVQAVHWKQESAVRTVMASDVPRTPARRSGEAPVSGGSHIEWPGVGGRCQHDWRWNGMLAWRSKQIVTRGT